mmetsp:Transcript_4090/g.5299  ORF Transcript_4090/g.5299 Transcript_4090/m.5299 type:complete len:154 (-) Transcript_4090:31-492(-)
MQQETISTPHASSSLSVFLSKMGEVEVEVNFNLPKPPKDECTALLLEAGEILDRYPPALQSLAILQCILHSQYILYAAQGLASSLHMDLERHSQIPIGIQRVPLLQQKRCIMGLYQHLQSRLLHRTSLENLSRASRTNLLVNSGVVYGWNRLP